jgi:transcriptional regulator with GAF, ATPase, and Fis domain
MAWLLEPASSGEPELVLANSIYKEGKVAAAWTEFRNQFARVPLAEPMIGRAARERKGHCALDRSSWHGGHPAWARRAKCLAYLVEPILFHGDLLGVMAVFLSSEFEDAAREQIDEACRWMRIFADFAGANVANARAFEEIEKLRNQLEQENDYLRDEIRHDHGFGEIIGESVVLKKCLAQVEMVAPTEANVLLLGESGTGKELLARAIHERSKRSARPLIKVNCASVPHDLFESEFFGHIKGAFTGAVADRRGRFQLADHGTLFLDEIGEIPLDLQGKLLRVLQEGTFERVGEDITRKVDVRIIVATNRDLAEEVKEKRFREDLYYRLSVFPIEMAPLRERPEDIPLLVKHFLRLAEQQLGCEDVKVKLKKKHILQLQSYDWPGNVRELQNVVQRAVIMARAGHLEFDVDTIPSTTSGANGKSVMSYKELRQLELANLKRALEQSQGKIFGPGGAAELLETNPTTLISRMKTLGVQRPRGR